MTTLNERAALLWPDSPAMRERWIAAVGYVRGTKRGWTADIVTLPPVPIPQPEQEPRFADRIVTPLRRRK